MSKQTEALKLALEFAKDIQRGKYKGDAEEVITAIRKALAEPEMEPAFRSSHAYTVGFQDGKAQAQAEQPAQQCNPHPKAPHGFNRNASHSADRYVCDCEGWDAYDAGYQAGFEKALELDEQPALDEDQAHYKKIIEDVQALFEAKREQPAQQCQHQWKNVSSKRQTAYQCELCGIYTFEKPWVGLTATEVHETDGYEEDRKLYRFARAIEAKLKEKNQ